MRINLKLLLIGTLLGTLVSVFWGATEWFNPLLHEVYDTPENPTALHAALNAQLPESGIYVWPQGPDTKTTDGLPIDLMYFMVKADRTDYQPGKFMGVNLLHQLIIWTGITWLLLQFSFPGVRKSVFVVIVIGGVAGFSYLLPMANWWAFPLDYALSRWLNMLVGWTLAGTVVAYYLNRNNPSLNLNQ